MLKVNRTARPLNCLPLFPSFGLEKDFCLHVAVIKAHVFKATIEEKLF